MMTVLEDISLQKAKPQSASATPQIASAILRSPMTNAHSFPGRAPACKCEAHNAHAQDTKYLQWRVVPEAHAQLNVRIFTSARMARAKVMEARAPLQKCEAHAQACKARASIPFKNAKLAKEQL